MNSANIYYTFTLSVLIYSSCMYVVTAFSDVVPSAPTLCTCADIIKQAIITNYLMKKELTVLVAKLLMKSQRTCIISVNLVHCKQKVD